MLRADNLAEKNQWVTRLRMHTKAGKDTKDAPPAPPAQQDRDTKEAPSDSEASDPEREKAPDKDGEVRGLIEWSQCSCLVSPQLPCFPSVGAWSNGGCTRGGSAAVAAANEEDIRGLKFQACVPLLASRAGTCIRCVDSTRHGAGAAASRPRGGVEVHGSRDPALRAGRARTPR